YDMVSDCIEEVKVAHPLKVKMIAEARIKTDKISADILAHLLRTDLIPECYVRNNDSQRIQQVLRQRMFLVRLQTMVKNKIHNLIDRQENARQEVQNYTDLFGARGFQFLRSVEIPILERKLLDGQIELLEELRTRISYVESILEQLQENDEIVERLKTIPGIGKHFAMLLRHEIDKIGRFSTSDKLCSYAGLVPATYSSGGKTYHGRIVKQGNKYIRWALIEAVVPAIRADTEIRNYYYSMKAKKGSNSAKVATARRLLKIVFQVWKENRFYRIRTLRTALVPS
ncbi:MAG: IS110 family transposase, partial [Nanoarchaeota archaeon]